VLAVDMMRAPENYECGPARIDSGRVWLC
jgi:hypothetical protein